MAIQSELAGKYLKPYQGLKRIVIRFLGFYNRRKIPKTLSGIETRYTLLLPLQQLRRKIPKTLSGIETTGLPTSASLRVFSAGKYLKPYQGLKRHFRASQYLNKVPPENT